MVAYTNGSFNPCFLAIPGVVFSVGYSLEASLKIYFYGPYLIFQYPLKTFEFMLQKRQIPFPLSLHILASNRLLVYV